MAREKYSIVEGSYIGTSNDCVGRWYIVDYNGDCIDKRSRGMTRVEARRHRDDLNDADELLRAAKHVISTVRPNKLKGTIRENFSEQVALVQLETAIRAVENEV